MSKHEREIIAFWWGRVLPESCKHLANLSILCKDEIAELSVLKETLIEAKKKGVDLTWGHHVKKKSVGYSGNVKFSLD